MKAGAGSESHGRREQEREGEGEKERERWTEMHTFTVDGAEVSCVETVGQSPGLGDQHQCQAACPSRGPAFSPRRPASGPLSSSLDYCTSPGDTRKERRREQRRSGG